jgi:hypothetical protein
MTEGAPTEESNPPVAEFSASAYLAKRGLGGHRRMEFGGEWFEFLSAAPSAKVAAFSAARQQADLLGAMTALLASPDEDNERLTEAFARQPQPIDKKGVEDYVVAIVNFLVAGDAGESSAS